MGASRRPHRGKYEIWLTVALWITTLTDVIAAVEYSTAKDKTFVFP
jgi:hypothetical protein